MMTGAYPPGVDGELADRADGDGPCCENCRYFRGWKCSREWNNDDEYDYIPERDDREPGDWCKSWENV
jgi:hypothetical protein